jgi:hypothetical protein
VLRAPAGRERVRHIRRDHRDARLRQVGQRAEPLDHRVQLRRLLGPDHLGPGRGQRDLVRGEVLEEREPADDHDHHQDPGIEDLEEDDGEDHV